MPTVTAKSLGRSAMVALALDANESKGNAVDVDVEAVVENADTTEVANVVVVVAAVVVVVEVVVGHIERLKLTVLRTKRSPAASFRFPNPYSLHIETCSSLFAGANERWKTTKLPLVLLLAQRYCEPNPNNRCHSVTGLSA